MELLTSISRTTEASADFGLLVTSLRAESFHQALYESMGLAGRAATAARMLERPGAAISAELTAIESIERRADENRRVRYAVAVGFVSAVTIPASLILRFLAINASQVDTGASIFSHRYLAVGAVIAVGILLSVGLWAQQRRESRHYRAGVQRPR